MKNLCRNVAARLQARSLPFPKDKRDRSDNGGEAETKGGAAPQFMATFPTFVAAPLESEFSWKRNVISAASLPLSRGRMDRRERGRRM